MQRARRPSGACARSAVECAGGDGIVAAWWWFPAQRQAVVMGCARERWGVFTDSVSRQTASNLRN